MIAQDIVSGNNFRVSAIGDSIRQPGLIDINCANIITDEVAKLSRWKDILPKTTTSTPVNLIDAAIAETISGKVRIDGNILGIGILNSNSVTAIIGLRVMKAGRTTGLTYGIVTGLNAIVDVSYSRECGSTSTFVARFTNQIVVSVDTSANANFSDSGDSGSLIATRESNPSAVGLLFAGGSGLTFINRISDILNEWLEENNITKSEREMGRTEIAADSKKTSFSNLVSELPDFSRNLKYTTHNMDSTSDTLCLLALFDQWITYADILKEK